MRRHRGSQGTIRSLPVSPCEPVTPMATPQRPPGNRLITGGAQGRICPPRRPIMSNHIRKRATRARSIKGRAKAPAPRNQPPLPGCWSGLQASRPRLDYAGQGEQDGRQNQAQAHGESLGNLVRLEFRPLCRDPHVARCTPVPGARRALLDLGLKGPVPTRYHPCRLPAPTFPALSAGGLSLVARSLVYLHSEETSGLRPPSRKT